MASLSTKDYHYTTGQQAMIIAILAVITVVAWIISRPIVNMLGV